MRFQIVGGGHGSRGVGLSMIKTIERRKMAGLESISVSVCLHGRTGPTSVFFVFDAVPA